MWCGVGLLGVWWWVPVLRPQLYHSIPGLCVVLLQLDTFLATLPKCVSRDLIDNFASQFVQLQFNTKLGRLKLIRSMYQGQRTTVEMLPYLARLTATLDAAIKGFAKPLLEVGALVLGPVGWMVVHAVRLYIGLHGARVVSLRLPVVPVSCGAGSSCGAAFPDQEAAHVRN